MTVKPDKNTGTKRARIIPGLMLIALFGAVSAFFAWKIADYLRDERTSLDYWEGLQDSVVIPEAPETPYSPLPDNSEQIDLEPDIPESIDFDALRAVSADAVAWLYAPGMNINYAVAQSGDNSYYLRRLLDGTYANGGSLFADYRCSADFSDWNTVIYGHQMNNGTMFGELENYRDQSYYAEHPAMYLYIPGKRYTLELIAGYITDVNDAVYSMPASKVIRNVILAQAARKSTFVSDVTPGENDKLVTLSTCVYDFDDARYVVIGRLVEA